MNPCVLVASTCDTLSSDAVIKGILSTDTLPDPLIFTEGVRSFPWRISTKYYEADIHVCALDKKTIGSQSFADSVNAVVICFDSSAESSLDTVEQWLAFTKEFEAQIKILVCQQCREDPIPLAAVVAGVGVSKYEAQSWCVRNGFELVELDPIQGDTDSDIDDDFPESVGMPRLIQALQAHLWPNLTLKAAAERQILPPHAGLQDIANGFSPQDSISGDATDFDRESGQRKEREIKVAKVKPMVKLVPSDEAVFTVGAARPANCSQEGPTGSSQLRSGGGKVTHSSSSRSSDAHCESSDSVSSSSISREINIVPPMESPVISSTEPNESASSSNPQEAPSTQSTPPAPPRDDRIDSMLEALDSMSEDNFEQLFQNLSLMKSKAANLSPTERKAYAEQMAMAFWRSLGGDEAEVDLSSGDED